MLEKKTHISYVSVGVNVFLSLAKLVIGLITGSSAILSEAAHSISDLLTSIVAMVSIHKAKEPADLDHPYGHGKYENVGSLFEALIIFASGALAVYKAIHSIIFKVELMSLGLGMGVMLGAAVINLFMSSFLIKKGRELKSPVLEADGWHSRTDVFSAAGVFIALGLIKLTGLELLDPIAAIIVSVIIFRLAIEIGQNSINTLVDKRPASDIENTVTEIIERHSDQFLEYHSLRMRESGSDLVIDLHLVFPDNTTLRRSHDLTEHLEEEIKKKIGNAQTLIHIEPCELGKQYRYGCKVCKEYNKCVESGHIVEKGQIETEGV